MASIHTLDVAKRAKAIYESELRSDLEKDRMHQFVAIEPDSGEHFVGDTLSLAIQAARKAYPDRISFALRVGHRRLVHLRASST